MFASKIRLMIASAALVTLSVGVVPSFAQEAKVPQTVQEHEARAEAYKKEAAQYRAAAAEHREMAADYAKAHPDFKGGTKNPWNAKMQKHCAAMAKDYDKLATDAEKAADYHSMRAKEMQGQ